MPAELNEIIYYIVAFIFVIALILVGARLLSGTGKKSSSKGGGSFLRGRERRLGVVEAASVDGRRKLILLRRDDTEHLIMTGGPVDVVVETGIHAPSEDMPEQDVTPPPPVAEPQPAPQAEPVRKPIFGKSNEVSQKPSEAFEKPADNGPVEIARNEETVAPTHDRET